MIFTKSFEIFSYFSAGGSKPTYDVSFTSGPARPVVFKIGVWR
jgi:hypothetical protein